MQYIEITEHDFDALLDKLENIEMENDGYIPSEEDVFDYIEKNPERYYLYLLWYSEHKPKPQTEVMEILSCLKRGGLGSSMPPDFFRE